MLDSEFGEYLNVARRSRNYSKKDKERSRDELINSYLYLVIEIALKYNKSFSIDIMDLIGEGNVGLMKAIERYDSNRGFFPNYARWHIKNSIQKGAGRLKNKAGMSLDFEKENESLYSCLSAEESKDQKYINARENQELVNSILKNLDQRRARIVEKRFGLNRYQEMTLEKIAEEEGVTKMGVSYIISKSLVSAGCSVNKTSEKHKSLKKVDLM